MEEHSSNWVAWAQTEGLHFSWPDFYLANITVVLFGAIASTVGWRMPVFSLGFPAMAGINALVFHVAASLRAGRPNPGMFSAIALFIPLVSVCFIAARKDGVLSSRVVFGSIAFGAAVHAVPFVLLAVRPYLRY